MTPPKDAKRIRVMVLMEADTVTGPAKILLALAKTALDGNGDLPGVDVLVTTFHRPGAKEDFMKAVGYAGLNLCVIPENHVLDFRILPKLRTVVADFSPDVILTNSTKSHFLMKWLGFHRIYPWIAYHHGYTTTDTKMRVYNLLDWYSLRSAHHVIVVCKAFCGELLRKGVRPERLSVQHNMVLPFVLLTPSQVDEFRSLLGIKGNTQVVLCVGRLSREKGHADLIRAVARMHQDSPQLDFRLILVGDGPERQSLHRLSRDLGIEKLIMFAGYQSDVSIYYSIANVCVLPSHSEGSPNALMEAMAAGVPILATSVGGVPEIAVHEENALLVQKGDTVEMAKGIVRLLTDIGLRERLIQNGLRVTELYNPTSYRRNMVQIFKNLLPAPVAEKR